MTKKVIAIIKFIKTCALAAYCSGQRLSDVGSNPSRV
jgi:hypothetical protein